MTAFLDRLFADFDEAEAKRELEDARRQVQALQDTLAAYEQWHDRERSAPDFIATGNKRVVVAEAKMSNGRRRGQTSRAVIRKLLSAHDARKEWTTPDVRTALGLDSDADHAIQTALSRMERAGELERPSLGRYRLPPDGEEPERGKQERGISEEVTP